ncbi:NAD(P)H-binding protein [Sinomonas sp. ASV322]|uniref:SDR family oxidoreductase n=1 Tax=Sinomonas sp. ASV322 TaxID=3041920 RepID=UPI0027DCAB93|nr:NAD(P)H-binding protein [Sinomonas sp. ASV322]MDQ4501359.1 NAD(P)H-binding protein [Sinomonas sp. ASV322]
MRVHSSPDMILVVGGTGRLGSRLVAGLGYDGKHVRIMARGANHPFPGKAGHGVELLRGSLASRADCEHAVEGCRQVVFAASGFGLKRGGTPRSVDRGGARRLVDAAAAAGVEHIVMMSMHGAAPDAPLEILRAKHAAEESVKASGLAWTAIRMGLNLDQFLASMSEPLETKGRVLVFGSGRAPVTFTSTADASSAVRRALADPALRGKTIEWGSETHTLGTLADAILANAGHGSILQIPVVALRVMAAVSRPFSPFTARMAAAALWMESGSAAFDPAPKRAEFPDIPVAGLRQSLPPLAGSRGTRG